MADSLNIQDWVRQYGSDHLSDPETFTIRKPLGGDQQMVSSEALLDFMDCSVTLPKNYVSDHVITHVEVYGVDASGEQPLYTAPMHVSVHAGRTVTYTHVYDEEHQAIQPFYTDETPLPAFALDMRRNALTVHARFNICQRNWFSTVVVVSVTTRRIDKQTLAQLNGCMMYGYYDNINGSTDTRLFFHRGNCYIKHGSDWTPERVANQFGGAYEDAEYGAPPPYKHFRGGGGRRSNNYNNGRR